MRNLLFFFLVGLSTGFISEKIVVSSMSPTTDDLYIEGLTSGDTPVDDEGDDDSDGSGSGSGDYAFSDLSDEERQLGKFFNLSRTILEEILPIQPQPTTDAPNNPTMAGRHDSAEDTKNSVPGDGYRDDLIPEMEFTTSFASTEAPFGETTELEDVEPDVLKEKDDKVFSEGGRRSRIDGMNSAEEVTSENLWERTDVLAAVIACGVVGFLCAVFLLMLLAYRMKKKDEGSYDLGDIKLSATAYHKAPTKEFYA